MKTYNRILGLIILICCLLLFIYFVFPNFLFIKTRLESWIYSFFFIIPILLLIASNRFKKQNDIRGRNLGYAAFLSFIGIIFFPIFIFYFDFFFLGLDLPDFIIMIFPFIALVLSLVVIYRLFKNNPIINPVNPITEHPYQI